MRVETGPLGVYSFSGSHVRIGVVVDTRADAAGDKIGARIEGVTPGGPAEKAGLKAGDVITKIGDRRVNSPNEISSALRSSSGGAVPVTVVRNQKEMTVNVTIERRSGGAIRQRVRMDVKTL